MFRGILTAIVTGLSTVVLGSLATIGSLLHRQSDICMKLGKLWSRVNMAATGLRPVWHGRERVDPDTPCIYLANHQSTMDIWLMILLTPPSARFVAKDSLFRIPILGWALSSAGFIPIDRANRNSAMRSLQRAAEKIRAGRPLVMFPEGTRSRDGSLARFKKGAFHLALQARVPVVPVSLRGTFEALPPGMYRVCKVPVDVVVHPAIDVTDYLPDNHVGLMETVRNAIASGLDEGDEGRRSPRAAGTLHR